MEEARLLHSHKKELECVTYVISFHRFISSMSGVDKVSDGWISAFRGARRPSVHGDDCHTLRTWNHQSHLPTGLRHHSRRYLSYPRPRRRRWPQLPRHCDPWGYAGRWRDGKITILAQLALTFLATWPRAAQTCRGPYLRFKSYNPRRSSRRGARRKRRRSARCMADRTLCAPPR